MAAKAWSVGSLVLGCCCCLESGRRTLCCFYTRPFPAPNDATDMQVSYKGTSCPHNCPLVGLIVGVVAGGQAGI